MSHLPNLIALVRRFMPCVHSGPSAVLVEAYDQFAQESARAGTAVRQLGVVALERTAEIRQNRAEIQERTATEKAKRPYPPTSFVREEIEAVVRKSGDRE